VATNVFLKGSRPPCSPISHCSDQLLPVCYNKNNGLPRELPTTGINKIALLTKPRWIPKCTNCNKLSQQQVVHIPHSLQAATVCSTFVSIRPTQKKYKLENLSRLKKSIPNQHILLITEMHHWFGKGQASQPPLNHKGILNSFQPLCKALTSKYTDILGWNCIPTLQFFPSYSRKPMLFGPVVAKFREAWQSVSTISRSKLPRHKPSPIATKTIQTRKEWLYHLPISFLGKKNEVLAKVFPYSLSQLLSKSVTKVIEIKQTLLRLVTARCIS
jgi:hypothetical protein